MTAFKLNANRRPEMILCRLEDRLLLSASAPVDGEPITPAKQFVDSAAVISDSPTMPAIAVGADAVFLSGNSIGGYDVYDGRTGTWSVHEPHRYAGLPDASAAADGMVFFHSEGSRAVGVFDAAADRWGRIDTPRPLTDPAVTALRGTVFFAGGLSETGERSSDVYAYHVKRATWSTFHLSQARDNVSAVSVGPYVVFAGGSPGADKSGDVGLPSDVVDIYDEATRKWSTATLSDARWAMAMAVVGQSVIFAGGLSSDNDTAVNGTPSNAVDIFNAATGKWSSAKLSQARSDIAVTVVGDQAIFVGGIGSGNQGPASAAIDIYNAATGRWSTGALKHGRYGVAATTLGPYGIFAGGCGGTVNGSEQPSTKVDVYDGNNGKWFTIHLARGVTDAAAVTVGPVALVAGGQDFRRNGVANSRIVNLFSLHAAGSSEIAAKLASPRPWPFRLTVDPAINLYAEHVAMDPAIAGSPAVLGKFLAGDGQLFA